MGTSSSKVPRYEIVEQQNQQASTSSFADNSRVFVGSFSPPSQGLLQQPSSSAASSSNVQQWAPVQQAPPPPLPQGWDFHIDPATGYPYFFNTFTGVSQWQDPRGPGLALPDRSEATHIGQRRQVIPPWEGGPVNADPLSWPLPPGWHEQLDQATSQRFFVNYDAHILSYNDPRLEISKAYVLGATAEGIPVNYPPPVIGRPMDEQPKPVEFELLGPAPPMRYPGSTVQGGASYLPPPPPWRKKRRSLWSKLGYRQGRGPRGGFPGGPSVFLFDNPDLPEGHDGNSDSSSSSSSDEQDNDNNEGWVDVGTGPDLNGQFDLGGGVDGNDLGGKDNDRRALDDYGNFGRRPPFEGMGEPPSWDSGSGAGGESNEPGFGGEGGPDVSGFQRQSLLGFWHFRNKEDYFQGWDAKFRPRWNQRGFWMMDGYTKIAVILTLLVGSYCGVFEGILSLLLVFSGGLILLMCKRAKIANGQGKRSGRRFWNKLRWVFKRKGSTLIHLKMAAVSKLAEMQAWCFEHVYEHPDVKLRVLTHKDNAAPLCSRLSSRAREITIVTQASEDRLPAIEAMARSWGGVICVAVHVRTKAELEEVYPRLCRLHEKTEAQGLCRLNICVAMEEGLLSDEAMSVLYPINAMRNIALSMATTELVFVLDADFVPSVGMHDFLTGDKTTYSEYVRMAKLERQVLVVPAFEGIPTMDEELDVSKILHPKNMLELREQWKDGSAKAFHCSHFPRGHETTNYEYFFRLSTSKPYGVPYREFYEPYGLYARELIPPFDARFRGYGLNKISHAYHCAMKGMVFCVLPHVFVWSLPHHKSEAWAQTFGTRKDPLQKLRILGLYRRFKSELHLLYKLEQKFVENSYPEILEIKVEEPSLPLSIDVDV